MMTDVWNRFAKPTPVEVFPLFVIVEEKVCATPLVAIVGVVSEAVRSLVGIVETTTSTHAPQLFPSFDSAIVPVLAAEFLSAQARTDFVPVVVNVYEEEEITLVAEAPKAVVEEEASVVIVPVPPVALAT